MRQDVQTFCSPVNFNQLNLETFQTAVFQRIKSFTESYPIFSLNVIVTFRWKILSVRSQKDINQPSDGFVNNISVFFVVVFNTFEVKVHTEKHLIIFKEKLIFSVPDGMFVIVIDDFFVV